MLPGVQPLGYNGGKVVPTGGWSDDWMIASISSNKNSLPSRDLGVETLRHVSASSESSNTPLYMSSDICDYRSGVRM